jgi:SAM-dependent methyltransferase
MPYRATFDCLWCGASHTCRNPDDLEGWAQLCPTCVGRAGDNGFLRYRLRDAIAERGRSRGPVGVPADAAATGGVTAGPAATEAPSSEVGPPTGSASTAAAEVSPGSRDAMVAYYEARAPEYDDWYLRRGRYARGPIHDAAWAAELDAAGRWLDGLAIDGRIVELAAGTGWWSPLLAAKGELWAYDAAAGPLDRLRDRLLAHRLRAHIHIRDAWEEPDKPADALFTGFWLSHVPRPRLGEFLALARRWLRPGGTFAFIDSLPDELSGAVDHPKPSDDRSIRRLDDGREFEIVKVYYRPDELETALRSAGFEHATVTTSGRFFLLGQATG